MDNNESAQRIKALEERQARMEKSVQMASRVNKTMILFGFMAFVMVLRNQRVIGKNQKILDDIQGVLAGNQVDLGNAIVIVNDKLTSTTNQS